MGVAAVETDGRQRARRSWAAAGAGAGSVAAAGFAGLLGVFADFELCLGGCPPGDSEIGAASILLFVLGAALLIAGLGWTAYVSRGTARDALVYGGLATGAVAAAALLVWVPLGAAGFAPGLVLAVGAAAAIVVREPAPLARYLRIAAIAVLVLATLVDDSLAFVLLAVLTFPAVALADMVALAVEADRES